MYTNMHSHETPHPKYGYSSKIVESSVKACGMRSTVGGWWAITVRLDVLVGFKVATLNQLSKAI
jgi:hypothetical protein